MEKDVPDTTIIQPGLMTVATTSGNGDQLPTTVIVKTPTFKPNIVIKNEYIYVIKLEDDYYYVGKTHNVEQRFQDHLTGSGSRWTTLHPPVELVETVAITNYFEEDQYVKRYMAIHGIDRVRGGSYVTDVISADQRTFLQKEIWAAQGWCLRCGRNNHLVKTCRAKTTIDNEVIFNASVMCRRCGRPGHTWGKCFARTKLDGSVLDT